MDNPAVGEIRKNDEAMRRAEGLASAGLLEAAAQIYTDLLVVDGDDAEALFRLGTTIGKLNRPDLELSLIGQAIARRPNEVRYHEGFAGAFERTGDLEDAVTSYEEADRLAPGTYTNRIRRIMGVMALKQGRPSEASDKLLAYLREEPRDAEALFLLGAALQEQDLLDPAVACYRQALDLRPVFYEARTNLGLALLAQGHAPEALRHLEEALILAPERPGGLLNRGNARRELGDLEGARRDYQAAVKADPEFAEAWSSLANLYHDLEEWSLALDAHRWAVELRPELAQARWNRAFTLMASGQWGEGWDEYEWRWRTKASAAEDRMLPYPRWAGEPLGGRRILVWRDQGLGDELLFATCLGDLVTQGATVTASVSPRLVSLFRRSFPGIEVVPNGDAHALDGRSFDYHSALGSLPRWLRRDRASFRGDGAYLVPDPNLRAKWAARLGTLGSGRKVGICWRSGLLTPDRLRHYPPAEAWHSLLTIPGIEWISLQYDDCEAELVAWEKVTGIRVHRWPGEDLKNDLESVVALIACLDAVVTAPTAVSSLAGAVGAPTYQVDSGSDWTAGGEARSPWFKTLQLASKHPGEGWEAAIDRAKVLLG
ncbi:MAG: tetratricopeptide repeat protein [Gemmatimonadota bacterium]